MKLVQNAVAALSFGTHVNEGNKAVWRLWGTYVPGARLHNMGPSRRVATADQWPARNQVALL